MELTLEGHHLTAQHWHNNLQRLRVPRHRLPGWVAELACSTTAVTSAEPKDEASTRDLIERLGSGRDHAGIAMKCREHPRTHLDRRSACSDSARHRQALPPTSRARPFREAPHDLISRPHGVEPNRFGPRCQRDDLGPAGGNPSTGCSSNGKTRPNPRSCPTRANYRSAVMHSASCTRGSAPPTTASQHPGKGRPPTTCP